MVVYLLSPRSGDLPMSENKTSPRLSARREFLIQASTAAALSATGLAVKGADAPAAVPGANAMPTIMLGKDRISRIVAGWNPIGGHSHTTIDMSRSMREYFTTERLVEFLTNCERQGINAWQYEIGRASCRERV